MRDHNGHDVLDCDMPDDDDAGEVACCVPDDDEIECKHRTPERCAEDGGTVTMAHLLAATRREYAKLEKTLTGAETGGWL